MGVRSPAPFRCAVCAVAGALADAGRPNAIGRSRDQQAWIEHWALTGNTTYNEIVTEAMLRQVGPEKDYEPPEQNLSLGNDDQAFWAIAALAAAERGFPDPPADKPQWLALAQAVFNRQAGRWDTKFCGGGLRWQVMPTNAGYDYKNTVSNGLLFQMGARLARYTTNATYADWAEKAYRWSQDRGLLTDKHLVYDGSHIPECTVSSKIMWSYNAGIYLAGAAYLYDYYVSSPRRPVRPSVLARSPACLLLADSAARGRDRASGRARV